MYTEIVTKYADILLLYVLCISLENNRQISPYSARRIYITRSDDKNNQKNVE